jgi:hypothetical protein
MSATQDLLFAVVDENNKRDDIAAKYAAALSQSAPVEWAAVNLAIKERWSMSGLKYIKELAWDLYEKEKS